MKENRIMTPDKQARLIKMMTNTLLKEMPTVKLMTTRITAQINIMSAKYFCNNIVYS